MMDQLYHYIVTRFLRNFRVGFYRATIGAKRDGFGRGEVVPEFLPDPVTGARTAICPVMDVKPPAGASVACLSHDAVPALPLTIGVIPDASFPLDGMKCWVQADLQDQPDVIELGAGRAVSIRVGEKGVTVSDPGDGTIRVAVDNGGKVVLDAASIELGEGAVNALLKDTFIDALVKAFDAHVHPSPNTPPVPLWTGPIETGFRATLTSVTKGK